MAKPLSAVRRCSHQGMQLKPSTRLPKRRARAPPAAPRPGRPGAAPRDRADARRGGGPQDRALYACVCGFVFTAAVTTSVGCPHCGTEQAW